MKSILLCDAPEQTARVYSDATLAALEAEAGLVSRKNHTLDDLKAAPKGAFADVEAVFSTWGMPSMTDSEIAELLPSLKAVYYSAGTVQGFARPFLDRGIRVFSAWSANGVPVAEYAFSQIILANKGFFRAQRVMAESGRDAGRAASNCYPGNFEVNVGLIGIGMIGSMVAERLKSTNLGVKAFDPFLPAERAKALGITLCSLEELFATCQVVSNHLANNAQTRGMIRGEHFRSMPGYATFINTGRGAQVVEDDLVAALRERPDLTAILDVTYPEPPVAGHPFYTLPNCILTPHIAGSSGNEVHRMAEYMLEEFRLVAAGRQPRYEVTPKMLATMA